MEKSIWTQVYRVGKRFLNKESGEKVKWISKLVKILWISLLFNLCVCNWKSSRYFFVVISHLLVFVIYPLSRFYSSIWFVLFFPFLTAFNFAKTVEILLLYVPIYPYSIANGCALLMLIFLSHRSSEFSIMYDLKQ